MTNLSFDMQIKHIALKIWAFYKQMCGIYKYHHDIIIKFPTCFHGNSGEERQNLSKTFFGISPSFKEKEIVRDWNGAWFPNKNIKNWDRRKCEHYIGSTSKYQQTWIPNPARSGSATAAASREEREERVMFINWSYRPHRADEHITKAHVRPKKQKRTRCATSIYAWKGKDT